MSVSNNKQITVSHARQLRERWDTIKKVVSHRLNIKPMNTLNLNQATVHEVHEVVVSAHDPSNGAYWGRPGEVIDLAKLLNPDAVVTHLGNGRYEIKIPRAKISVSANFVEIHELNIL